MQLACSLCKTYVEIGVGREMRPSLPFICKACRAKSRLAAAHEPAPSAGRASAPASGSARAPEGAEAPARRLDAIAEPRPAPPRLPVAKHGVVGPPVAGAEGVRTGAAKLGGATAFAPRGVIPRPVGPGRAPVPRVALRGTGTPTPQGVAPRLDAGDSEAVSIRDLEMMLSPGVEPPRLSSPSAIAPEGPEEAIEEVEAWDLLDEPSASVNPALGSAASAVTLRSSPTPEKPAAPPPVPAPLLPPVPRRPPPPPPPRRSPLDRSQHAPAAWSGSSSAEALAAPVPPAERGSSMASVPDPELPPATRRSHADAAPQVLDSSAADLQMMGALCPTPGPPAVKVVFARASSSAEARARSKTAGPDPSIWDVGTTRPTSGGRGAAAPVADNESPVELDAPVDSSLRDLRQIAQARAASIPQARASHGRRASDDVLHLSGGLFGSAASIAAFAPPALTAAPAAEPEWRAASPLASSSTSAPVISKPARSRAASGSRRRALAGWILTAMVAAAAAGGAIYFAFGGREPKPAPIEPRAVAAEPRSAPPPTGAPAALGAGPSDREPSLDDEPSPPGTAAPAPTQAAAEPSAPPQVDPGRRVEPGRTGAAQPATPAPVARPTAAAVTPPTPAPAPPPAAPAPPAGGAEFNKAAASAALNAAAGVASACKGDGAGGGKVAVTFAPSGRVTSARIESGPFVGTPTGGCIATAFRSARVPPFDGGPITVRKQVNIR